MTYKFPAELRKWKKKWLVHFPGWGHVSRDRGTFPGMAGTFPGMGARFPGWGHVSRDGAFPGMGARFPGWGTLKTILSYSTNVIVRFYIVGFEQHFRQKI